MSRYKEVLMRAAREDEKVYFTCSNGLTPRHGKPARRRNDCKLDCRDYEACDAQAKRLAEGKRKDGL